MSLFEDLEAELAAAHDGEFGREVSEMTRTEIARISLVERLVGQVGMSLTLRSGAGSWSGTLGHVGAEWLVLANGNHSVLVPFSALTEIDGLGVQAGQRPAGVQARLGFASALRVLARERATVTIHTGQRQARLSGMIDRVGSDHCDIAEVVAGECRRPQHVRRVVTVLLSAISAVESG